MAPCVFSAMHWYMPAFSKVTSYSLNSPLWYWKEHKVKHIFLIDFNRNGFIWVWAWLSFHLGTLFLPPLLTKSSGVGFSWYGEVKPTYHAQWLLFYSSYREESPPFFPLGPAGRLQWEGREGPHCCYLSPGLKVGPSFLPLFLWGQGNSGKKKRTISGSRDGCIGRGWKVEQRKQ